MQTVKKIKTSDTVFVVGSGPSLNQLSDKHFEIIAQHDSFAINYSFLKEEISPTFLQLSLENDWSLDHMKNTIKKKKKVLNNTVFFTHDKSIYRLAHPRIIPELFSINPKLCVYELPAHIHLESKRPFMDEDFDRTLFYRGTLTLVIELVLQLGYNKIVLLGVDPNKLEYFFDEYQIMKEYCEILYKIWESKGIKIYENMVPKGNKYHTIDTYFIELNKYLLKKKKAALFTGLPNTPLLRSIPVYFR
jgi:hypothetical protein